MATAVIQTFKKVQLIKVQGQGFRGIENPTVFDLEAGVNQIIGDNGKNKTSLGELIAWVFTGRNIEGKQKEINIINKNCDSAIGIVTFRDQDGNVHELERRQSSAMTLKLDYETIPQKRLEELLPMELFLCIFNPIYFLLLDPNMARKTILNLFPVLTKEGIIAEMQDHERVALENESFFVEQTNEYLKNRNKELAELDKDRKWLEGYIGKLKEKIIIPEPLVFDEKPLLAVQGLLDELNARKPQLLDIQELLIKRQEIQQKLAQAEHKAFDKTAEKAELLKEKALLEQQLKNELEKVYTPFNPATLDSKLDVLRNEYRHHKNASNTLKEQSEKLSQKHVHVKEGDQCPTCKQVISQESVATLEKELSDAVTKEKQELSVKQEEKAKTLSDLEAEGLKLLEEISTAKKTDEKKREEFETAKQKVVSDINTRLQSIDKELKVLHDAETTFNVSKTEQISILKKEIDELGLAKLETENARIEREFKTEVAEQKAKLQAELTGLQQLKTEAAKHEGTRQESIKREADRVKDLDKREKEMEGYVKKEEELRLKVFYMKAFNAKMIDLLNTSIKKHLTNVELKLQKNIESTGEVKDCFEIFYAGKELRVCSTSETIRAGLEISRMVSTLADVQFPVFIDNGESITSYEDPGFQTIEVRVVKGKALSMIKDGKEVEIVPLSNNIASSKPKATGTRTSRKASSATEVTEQTA